MHRLGGPPVRVAKAPDVERGDRTRAVSQQDRREVGVNLVDETRTEERGRDGGATLDDDVAHAPRPKLFERGGNEASGGADVGPMRALGMPVASLVQDGTTYFDYHHTANDTLDKVDAADLDQNVAAYVTLTYLIAEHGLPPAPQ